MGQPALKTPPSGKPPADNSQTENWHIIPFGDELFAYSRVANIQDAKKILVGDVGSGSVKGIVYDCTQTPPQPIEGADFNEKCGLGIGMTPNDPNPKLAAEELDYYYDVVLPVFKKVRRNEDPDIIIILCTEAIRAANENPKEKEIVNDLIEDTAVALGIDPQAVNIVDEELEARLAAEGVLVAHENADGFSDTMGGNSRERTGFKLGQIIPDQQITQKLGRNSLAPLEHEELSQTIQAANDDAPWFKTDDPSKKRKTLYLQGNAFRTVGRLLAQRLYRIDFRSKFPFHGHTIVNNDALSIELNKLKRSTFDDLLDEGLRFEFREQQGLKNAEEISEHQYDHWKKLWQGDAYQQWFKKWDKRIGQRVDFLRAAAEVILNDMDQVQPRAINFGVHSIREGVLRYAGLGL